MSVAMPEVKRTSGHTERELGRNNRGERERLSGPPSHSHVRARFAGHTAVDLCGKLLKDGHGADQTVFNPSTRGFLRTFTAGFPCEAVTIAGAPQSGGRPADVPAMLMSFLRLADENLSLSHCAAEPVWRSICAHHLAGADLSVRRSAQDFHVGTPGGLHISLAVSSSSENTRNFELPSLSFSEQGFPGPPWLTETVIRFLTFCKGLLQERWLFRLDREALPLAREVPLPFRRTECRYITDPVARHNAWVLAGLYRYGCAGVNSEAEPEKSPSVFLSPRP
ncbi:hypothetical protein Bbelb_016910 [Branchiostoma belcheri]|nr:hypothetical protein Bbelb_016910 [Branchiostoma belcheri]